MYAIDDISLNYVYIFLYQEINLFAKTFANIILFNVLNSFFYLFLITALSSQFFVT